MSLTRSILFILSILLAAIWIDLPGSPGLYFNLGGPSVDRSFDTLLGLDLMGGVQALLGAYFHPATKIDLRSPGRCREGRHGLGDSEAVVQLARDRRILVE